MILRAPLHLLILVGLLLAFGSQAAQSHADQRPALPVAASYAQPAAFISAAPGRQAIAATATLTNTTALTNTIYIPSMVQVAPPPIDLSIQGLEITQAVQTPSNSVPLVAGRPTIVRVYAEYAGTIVPGNVSVSLAGSRNGVALAPVKLGPQAISASPSRATYSSSFNIPLPTSWLSGTVVMTATVDSGAAVDESDETNNNATATLEFNSVPALDIVIVPINYTHTGPINPGVFPPPSVDTISDFIKRTYPLSTVHVTFHSPMNFTGDLSYIDSNNQAPYWGNSQQTGLLNRVTALKGSDLVLEGGINSPKVYYGLVSTGTTPSDTWVPLTSPKGFILGIGWVSTRASAGLDIPASFGLPADITSDTAAHEIGHNLGRQHAPCKTTTGLDADFPNSTASIEQFGVDVSKGKVLNPSTTKDVMSYCQPQWVSDYTYNALYNALTAKQFAAASAAPQASLLVRGGVEADGTASLAPVYSITGVPNPAPSSSGYRVEFLDSAGNVVGSQPVALNEMEQPHVVALSQGTLVQQANPLAARGMDTNIPQLAINAIVAAPTKPFTSMRLVRAGTVVATRSLRAAGPTIAAASARAERQTDGTLLRWNAASGPALVRYTADNGATWATLGVDVLGGELQINTATLPGGGYFEIIPADSAAPVAQVAAP